MPDASIAPNATPTLAPEEVIVRWASVHVREWPPSRSDSLRTAVVPPRGVVRTDPGVEGAHAPGISLGIRELVNREPSVHGRLGHHRPGDRCRLPTNFDLVRGSLASRRAQAPA